MRVLAAITVSLLACAVAGQSAKQEPATPEVAARRFAHELEIPARRREAIAALLRLGAPAVQPLLAQAKHPDLEIARVALQTLAALEHDGLTAVPELERLAKGDDARAQAAAWTLARLPRRGTFLVPSAEERVVREFDDTGKEISRVEKLGGSPWQIQMLANGNLLVADTTGSARELDANGKAVFEWKGTPIYAAERLIDGSTLVTAWRKGIVELDAKGAELWIHRDSVALHATRLPDGSTLVADHNKGALRELERDGTVRWNVDGYWQAYVAHRLRDGSTLVVQHAGKATLVAADGTVIRAFQARQQASDVVLLPDGWIECGNNYVRRCDAQGVERWSAEIKGWAGRITLR